MNEWDSWAEQQRQRNFQREQEELQVKANKMEADMVGGAVGGIIGLFFWLLGLVFVVLFFILKIVFSLLIFLRNRFFIHWNWYAKTENAIYQGLVWIKKITITILGMLIYAVFVLPFILLFRWWELWVIVGAVLIYYYYGK